MVCTICGTEGFHGAGIEPPEPCLCGERAAGSPWEWDRWRGVVNWLRYRLLDGLDWCWNVTTYGLVGPYWELWR